jgi:hypothetical protein
MNLATMELWQIVIKWTNENRFWRIQMDWSKVKIPAGAQLFRSHNFMYMIKGRSYELEISEYLDGKFVGYGQLSNDDSQLLKPFTRTSLQACLQSLIDSATAKE